jgi:hypothetical protein
MRASSSTLAAPTPRCLIHRTVVAIWRTFFHPPREDRGTTWTSGKKDQSKLVTEPPPKDRRARRRVRLVQ